MISNLSKTEENKRMSFSYIFDINENTNRTVGEKMQKKKKKKLHNKINLRITRQYPVYTKNKIHLREK